MKAVSENKKPSEPVITSANTKPDIINLLAEGVYSLVKSMDAFNVYQVRKEEDKKRDKRSHRWNSWGITITTLIVSLLGIFVTLHLSSVENSLKRKFQYQQSVQEQLRQQIQALDMQIHDKIAKRDNLNTAMSKTRNLLEVSHLYCKNGKYFGDQLKYSEQQLDYIYQLVNAVYSTYQIFDQNIKDQANYFLTLFDKNRNTCNQPEDFDNKLRSLQGQTNRLMNNSIFNDQQERKRLSNQLANSPLWKK